MKLLSSIFLLVLLNFQVVAWATLEDFTTYTEVDSGTIITIVDANNIGYSGDVNNSDNYVYSDKGSGNFGDYDIEYEIYTNTPNSSAAIWGYTGVSNTIDDLNNVASGQIHFCSPASGSQFWMIEYFRDKGNSNRDALAQHPRNTRYYIKIERSGTTATLKSYLDSLRTVLEDTASITCETSTYQYIYASSSYNTGNSGRGNNFEFDNLNIISSGAAGGGAPSLPMEAIGSGIGVGIFKGR